MNCWRGETDVANKKFIFLKEVTEQIKSKEAKKVVATELGFHIQEAKNLLIEMGLPEAEAEEKAIEQMGSPSKLGKQMNRLHKPKVDWFMIILLVTTLGLGFLPLASLGYLEDTTHFAFTKSITVLLGASAAIGIMLIDFRKWKTRGWMFYTLGVLFLLIIKFLSNTMINGVPLLRIPSIITLESSMVLPLFFLGWASFFSNERLKIWQFFILFFIPLLLLLAVSNITTPFMYTVMVMGMFWWSKFSRKKMMVIGGITFCLFLIMALVSLERLKSYQLGRILAFITPEKSSGGASYMILRVNELMSKAGWFGNHGNKEFIPSAHTDLVFVSLTYTYGWLFAIALFVILTLIMVRFIVISNKIHDSYAKLLLFGAVGLYGVQLVCNVGMALGVFPQTSISLPFISYGLMPVLLNSFLIGIVMSIYRRKELLSNRFV
ncbi:FtsW/RodA/SpoVE family cell cycle protein [Neobacillus sp. OS1-2]|uniref:FtsW/RodA/SpoVE family cell cycle protein n=1 Tax=Neobacillus sp. OS1-2 TaxID=3070680 RepID=UPI0027DF473A|nr:FtsW/RodA/SpoVE family cell cycle protein [Neobacillus sp. OS1-2]WML39787.1 FtsW/RodA/SpoVE family cell cycle protein [Neobacillus sp. OS1-2]